MVTNSSRSFFKLLGEAGVPLLPIVVYVVAISWLDLQFHLEDFNFPVPIVAVLGTVIGLLLAFRTNSSYGRWWEARTFWGAIVNDSRTWTRQLLEFSASVEGREPPQAAIRKLANRQAAWCYALSRNLLDQDPTVGLQGLIDDTEIESYQSSENIPNEMLLRQAMALRTHFKGNHLELYQFVELERTLARLTDSMGGCERIKKTPFPAMYSQMVHGMIYVFVVFLPFGLVDVPAVGLVFTSLSISFGFLLIDRVAVYLQDPFSNRPSDTPMLVISNTIESNIKQMLDVV